MSRASSITILSAQEAEMDLDNDELEFIRWLETKSVKPLTKSSDTVAARLKRYEDVAQGIKELLADEDLNRVFNDGFVEDAQRIVQAYEKEKKRYSSGIFKAIPAFLPFRSDDVASQLLELYNDMKTKASIGWRSERLANLKKKVADKSRRAGELVGNLQSTLSKVQDQAQFGQLLLQVIQSNSDGMMEAEVESNVGLSKVYIDFSGRDRGRRASGAYGSIHLAWTSRTKTGEVFAVKVPNTHRTSQNELWREGEIWETLQSPTFHPNILELRGTCLMGKRYRGLISRWISGGKSWKACVTDFETPQQLIFLGEISSAVGFMHSKEILHGDLKLDNVIICPSPLKALLCDFGHSLRRNIDNSRGSVRGKGSAGIISPEGVEGIRKSYTSDSWSFGVCIMHALLKKMPFGEEVLEADNPINAYHKIFVLKGLRPTRPLGIDQAGDLAWSVALACLRTESEARPPMIDVAKALREINEGLLEASQQRVDQWKETYGAP